MKLKDRVGITIWLERSLREQITKIANTKGTSVSSLLRAYMISLVGEEKKEKEKRQRRMANPYY